MKIKTRRAGCGQFVEVIIQEDNTTINLGLLGESECEELAEAFISAAHEIGPRFYQESTPWFFERIAKCGIDMPNAPREGRAVARTLDADFGRSDHV